ncbi:MAG: hypothetical protein NVSMB66_6940 [Candidatus Doudnabacteria bacterium]
MVLENNKLFTQIYRFIVVGVINTGIDLIVLNILIVLSGKGKEGVYYTVFKSISFLVSVTASFFMNKYWTFVGEGKNSEILELSEFAIISLIGFVINVGVATLIIKFISPLPVLAKYWPSVAALGGTAIGLIWNFFGYKYVVFEKKS